MYELVACFYAEGELSVREIGRLFGLDHHTILEAMRRRGIQSGGKKYADRRVGTKDLVEQSRVLCSVRGYRKRHPDLVPEYCEICLKDGPVEAHHEDYSKRFDVEWICSDCHYKLHRLLRRYPYLSKLYS